jgi:hypothetical protein
MTDAYTFTEAAIERGAQALAEAINGGRWQDYTREQREVWRRRVRLALEGDKADG